MGKVSARFIEETIFGLSARGSVRLTEIARSLEEDVELHATHKRLSRNLTDKSIGSAVELVFRLVEWVARLRIGKKI